MSTPLRVLLVEDSENDALLLLAELRRGGYSAVHKRVFTAEAMNAALREGSWDIVISDFVMPSFSGLAALQLLQKKKLDIPFILVSGQIGEEMAVIAMKAGADDFVSKANIQRLIPAIDRELREAENRRQRRRAESRMRASEEGLHNLIASNADGMVVVDHSSNVCFMNPAAEALLGVQAGESIAGVFGVPVPSGVPTDLEIATPKRGKVFVEMRVTETEWEGDSVYLVALRDITRRKQGEEAVRDLTRRLVEMQENERRAIARELHDQTGQLLTGLKMLLDRSLRSRENAESCIRDAQEVASELINQVRNMSFQLRPSTLDDMGLVPTLLMHFERFTNQTQITVDFQHDELSGLPLDVSTAVYRIVQEALTNVARHSGANKAAVRIWREGNTLCLEISDQGKGFAGRSKRPSNGVSGMQERARLLGGTLEVNSAQGEGARVSARIPLNGGQRNGQASSGATATAKDQ